MKVKLLALAMFCVTAFTLTAYAAADIAENVPDYSQKASWYKIPAITKDVDTFLYQLNGVHH